MKILYLLPSLANKGPIIFTKYLINRIDKTKNEIHIWYFKESENPIRFDNVYCKRIPFLKKKSIREFDIINSTMPLPDLYCAFFTKKANWVCSIHNFEIDIDNKLKKIVVKMLWLFSLKKCENIIYSSIEMQKFYRKKIGLKKNECIIPYGIEKSVINPINEKDRKEIEKLKEMCNVILGSVGSLIYRKGFHQILEVLKNNSDYGLILIGDGNQYDYLKAKIEEYSLSNRVILFGFRNYSYNYYKYFDIYMHVSYSEGFGLAMLEALAQKIPVVCSQLNIYKEYFNNQQVSYFIPDDVNSLEFSVKNVLKNFTHYQEESYKLFLNYFNDEKMMERYLDFYHIITTVG